MTRTRHLAALLAVLALGGTGTAAGTGSAADPLPCVTAPVPGDDRCEQWEATYSHTGRGGRGEDIGRAVAAAPDGRSVTVGVVRDDVTGSDALAVAHDADGRRLWVARRAQPGYGTFSGVAVDATLGLVVATGRAEPEPMQPLQWETAAFDLATGALRWVAVLPATADGQSAASYRVAVDADRGTVYVGGDDGDALRVVAYDAASGGQRWSARRPALSGFASVRGLAVSSGGAVVATAVSDEGEGTSSVTLAWAPTGLLAWTAVDPPAVGGGAPAGLALAGSSVVVAATSGSDVAVVARDVATGAVRWRATSGSAGTDTAAGVAATPDGSRVYVARTTAPQTATGRDVGLATYTDDGTLLRDEVWTSPGRLADTALAVTAVGDGSGAVVAGYHVVPRGEVQPVFKIEPGASLAIGFDRDGVQRWAARHTASVVGADVAVAAAAVPGSRRVLLAGTFLTSGVYLYPTDLAYAYAWDIGTLAYDA